MMSEDIARNMESWLGINKKKISQNSCILLVVIYNYTIEFM